MRLGGFGVGVKGSISILTEAKQKDAVHRSVPQVLNITIQAHLLG